MKIALENKPPQLEETDRKIRRLEIELAALKKDEADNVGKNTKTRIKAIEKEVAELRETTADLEVKWKNEKEVLAAIGKIKKEVDQLKNEAESAEARADLGRAAEIRYGKLPSLAKELETEMNKLKRFQRSRRVLKEEVTDVDIAQVVSRWTGVPVSRMLEAEAKKLARMEEELRGQVVGQDDAVKAVSDAVKRSRVGIADPNRPIGSFLFLGPTGVGKTELSKALAKFMFDDEGAIIRVDMSEFMEKHSVSKIIGSPP
ncbi:AAA family ATPase, partial [Patescibacteria group bacterium]|nr:AAA family ATPase [Patescibacteria group bacterium]